MLAGARPVSICHSKQQLLGKHIPSSKSYSLLAQTITEKMEPSDKDYWRKFVKKLYHVPIAKDRELSVRVKMHQFFKIFTTIHLISFWSLLDDQFGYFFSDPFNLKNKIMKIEHKNILWPINNFEKSFMVHQYA